MHVEYEASRHFESCRKIRTQEIANDEFALYTTSADMLAQLHMSLAGDTLLQALKPYTRAELLVVDEVGLEQVERNEARRSGLMQKVLLPRYNEHRSTIITSNIPWEAWGDYLGDHLGATALVDRMIHHSHVIVINGPSYRDWEHQQDAGTVRPAALSMPEPGSHPPFGGPLLDLNAFIWACP